MNTDSMHLRPACAAAGALIGLLVAFAIALTFALGIQPATAARRPPGTVLQKIAAPASSQRPSARRAVADRAIGETAGLAPTARTERAGRGGRRGVAFLWRFALLSAVWNVIVYAATAYWARDRHRTTSLGELGRGALVGTNAAMNAVIAFVVLLLVATSGVRATGVVVGAESDARAVGAASTVGVLVSAIVLVFPLLSLWPAVARSRWYHRLAGWGTSVMPMSWPVQALGLFFLVGSALLSAVTFGRLQLLRLLGVRVDWESGSFFVRGGIAANANYLRTAFNMGGFSFVHRYSQRWHIAHEAGHTLCLTSFGSVFHFAGALDENIWPGRGAVAYAERLAHSNVVRHGPTTIPMWRPPPGEARDSRQRDPPRRS